MTYKRLILALLFVLPLGAQQLSQNIITVIPTTNSSGTPTASGEVRYRDLQSPSHYVFFSAPDTVTANAGWKLPASDAHGCWVSDGSGNLSIDPSCTGTANVVTTNTVQTITASKTFNQPIIIATATGAIQFQDQQMTPHYVAFAPASSIPANVTWTLPTADQAGCFVSNGSGVMSIDPTCSGTGNFVTLTTNQTITGSKTFNAAQTFGSTVTITGTGAISFNPSTGLISPNDAFWTLGGSANKLGAIYTNNIYMYAGAFTWTNAQTSNLNSSGGATFQSAVTINGALTVNSCSGCTPSDMVTTDTTQTISGAKTFTNSVVISGTGSLTINPSSGLIVGGDAFWSLGGPTNKFGALYTNNIYMYAGAFTWTNSQTANLNSSGGATFQAAVTINGALTVNSASGINVSGPITVASCTGCTPSDMVTTDTTQTISGAKTFTASVVISGTGSLTINPSTGLIAGNDAFWTLGGPSNKFGALYTNNINMYAGAFTWTNAQTAFLSNTGGAHFTNDVTVVGALTVNSCSGCGVASVSAAAPLSSTGGANPTISCPTCLAGLSATSPIQYSSNVVSCPNCVDTTSSQSISGAKTFTTTVTVAGTGGLTINPSTGLIIGNDSFWTLGGPSNRFGALYTNNINMYAGAFSWTNTLGAFLSNSGGANFLNNISMASNTIVDSGRNSFWNSVSVAGSTVVDSARNGFFTGLAYSGNLTDAGITVIDSSRNGNFNAINVSSVSASSFGSFNGGITMPTGVNSQVVIGPSGNFYGRYLGIGSLSSNVFCSGVPDGWMAIADDGFLVVCFKGVRARAQVFGY